MSKKLQLKHGMYGEIKKIMPYAFEEKEEMEDINYFRFIKVNKLKNNVLGNLVYCLGTTYLGYIYMLINTLEYDNSVDLGIIGKIGIDRGMKYKVRDKLLDNNVIAKIGDKYYMNPEIAVRGKDLPKDIVEAFSKKNDDELE